jgi:hypothetical protein
MLGLRWSSVAAVGAMGAREEEGNQRRGGRRGMVGLPTLSMDKAVAARSLKNAQTQGFPPWLARRLCLGDPVRACVPQPRWEWRGASGVGVVDL